MKKVQRLTTFNEQKAIDSNPRSIHMMVTYDEIIAKPMGAECDVYKRDTPVLSFLVPDGTDTSVLKNLGRYLEKAGKEMKTGKEKCYNVTHRYQDFHELNFGKYHQGKRPADIGPDPTLSNEALKIDSISGNDTIPKSDASTKSQYI